MCGKSSEKLHEECQCVSCVCMCARGAHSHRCQLCRVTCCNIPGLCGDCHTGRHQLPRIPLTSNKLIACQCQEMTGLTMKQADPVIHARSHSSLPANTHYYMSDPVRRGISILTHSEANNHKVYLSPIGNKYNIFPLALASRNWTAFNMNKITPAIKKMLSSLNRVLLHSGHRDCC